MKRRYALGSWLTGAATARAGDEMSGPALMLAGFALTGSASEASLLLGGVTIAAVAGGPVLGALLDRAVRPGRLLAGALALYATGLTVILMGLGRLPLPAIVLIAVVTGLSGPALSGGWTAQLPRVVPREGLARASALDAMTFSLASLLGPALAGGTTQLFGAPAAVTLSVALIGLATPAAWRLPATPGPTGPSTTTSIVDELAAGVRFIARNPRLGRATLASVISCAGQGMLTACIPLLGARALGGAGHGTMLLSCTAVSAVAANAVLARFPRRIAPDTLIWGSTLLLATASALATTGRPTLLITAALVAGIGEGPQLTALFAVRHEEAPGHMRGQLFTTGASLKLTGFAVGATAAGPLATMSLPAALATAASLQLLAALACFAIPETGWPRRRRDPAVRTENTGNG